MEIRKDYLSDRHTIIAENRISRPYDFAGHGKDSQEGRKCDFCPGSEQMTLPEIGHIGSPWQLRWFPNKYPLADSNVQERTNKEYFTSFDSYGFHEVIVETNNHLRQLYDFSPEEIKVLLDIYCDRIRELSSKEKVEYVFVFKNHGVAAGASLNHSHSHVLALNHLPELVWRELKTMSQHDSCPYCEILSIERHGPRYCFENEGFMAFVPYAPRFNYELWIFPKKHLLSITQLDDQEKHLLAQLLQKALEKVKSLGVSFNILICNSPEGFIKGLPEGQKHGLHFRIMITPKMSIRAALEDSYDLYTNTTTPESAAEFYRG